MNAFHDLSQWYNAQCDGNWEHDFGVHIETLDDPGWWVRIDLSATLLEEAVFERVEIGDPESDELWIICEKKDAQFQGIGDPSKLEEIIQRFVTWARDRNDWLAVPTASVLQARRDAKLWKLLGESHGAEPCRMDGCDELRIKNSVFCRRHHWKEVVGRPLPDESRG